MVSGLLFTYSCADPTSPIFTAASPILEFLWWVLSPAVSLRAVPWTELLSFYHLHFGFCSVFCRISLAAEPFDSHPFKKNKMKRSSSLNRWLNPKNLYWNTKWNGIKKNWVISGWKQSPVVFYYWISLRNTNWLSFQPNIEVGK